MARVLVGISTRNRPDLVRETVKSVLNQTFKDIRVIVSENPSDPAISDSVSSWIAGLHEARISYYLQPIDGGEYAQGRYLYDQCREPYFCMIHDDDLMDPGYLEQALAVLDADPDLAFFSSGQYLIDADGRFLPEMTERYALYQARDRFSEGRMDDTLSPLLKHGLFSISGTVFRTSSIRDHGLVDSDIGGIYPFEFNVFLRIAERGMPAWYTPRRLIAYRWHDTSMRQADGSIHTRYMVETLVLLLERRRFSGRAEKLRRRLLSYNLRNLGYICIVANERKAGLRALLKALQLNPRGVGLWAYFTLALVAPGYVRARWRDRVNLAPPSPSWAEAIPAGASAQKTEFKDRGVSGQL
jgi:glycosyltransferase involved in cell wall biosynthesis